MSTISFGAELTAYGENFADSLTLPKNASVTTESRRIGGTMGSVEMLVEAVTATTAASLTITVEDSKDGVTFAPTGWSYKAPAGAIALPGACITRFCMPSNVKAHVRLVVATTDAAATGAIALKNVYLPR